MSTSTIELGSSLPLPSRERKQPAGGGASLATTPNANLASASTQTLNQAQNQTRTLAPDQALKAAPEQQPNKSVEAAQTQRTQLTEVLDRISRLDRRLSFEVDEDSGKSVVLVRDARTSEVLKQFPSEEMLNVARRLEEHLKLSGDVAGVLHADEA